jgi:hypothetical protein
MFHDTKLSCYTVHGGRLPQIAAVFRDIDPAAFSAEDGVFEPVAYAAEDAEGKFAGYPTAKNDDEVVNYDVLINNCEVQGKHYCANFKEG